MKYFIFIIALILSCGVTKDDSIQLFKLNTDTKLRKKINKLKEYSILDIQSDQLDTLNKYQPHDLLLSLPYKDDKIKLQLNKVELFADDFKITISTRDTVEYNKGIYYEGVVVGEKKSSVTLSIINNEVTGMINSPKFGDLNIVKQGLNNHYISYLHSDLDSVSFTCGTDSLKVPELQKMIDDRVQKLRTSNAVGSNCASIDFELSYSIYQHFGTVQKAIDWFTPIFAGVKTIYKNEKIDIVVKSFFVHTTPDGYNANAATALNQVRERRRNDPAFAGNFVQLIIGRTTQLSGIAFVDVLCVKDYRFSLSIITFASPTNPVYSWPVEVVAHELGHNFCSPHTHSCSWKGGAIDGCYTQEGSCAKGPIPCKGCGTVMSYCHMLQAVQIQFSNGFGPQPGDLIRQRFAQASCLSGQCGSEVMPTCADGVRNGAETGVDCGGTCPPCPVSPPGNPVISKGRPATQSSQWGTYTAGFVNDGNNNTFQSTNSERMPWVQIDLQGNYKITNIEILNRMDCAGCGMRLRNFNVSVDGKIVHDYKSSGVPYGMLINLPINASGRYIKVTSDNSAVPNYLHLAEIKVSGLPAGVIYDTFKVCRDSIVIR